ncbi:MAG: hypothetical protein ACLFVP_05155 [Candidatus Bathyarchaeia archaeon]
MLKASKGDSFSLISTLNLFYSYTTLIPVKPKDLAEKVKSHLSGHNWYYPIQDHRICKKCGETQRLCYSSKESKKEVWEYILFDVWLKELDKVSQMEEIKKRGMLRSRAKAMMWLKKQGVL